MEIETEEIETLIARTRKVIEMQMSAVGKLQYGLRLLRETERSLCEMIPPEPGSIEEMLAELRVPIHSRLVQRQ
jgi:hypothetical protein